MRQRVKYRKGTVGPWVLFGKLPARGQKCYICDMPMYGEVLHYTNIHTGQNIIVGSGCVKEFEARGGGRNPTLAIPVKSRKQLSHLFKAQSQLRKAGVTFDTGLNMVKPERHWELDWSLKGAKIRNPKKRKYTQTIGNVFGGLGILSISLFIGLIIWANRRFTK